MNTPAHLIFAAAAFARPGEKRANIAVLLGALAPDISLYVMAGVSLFILGIPARIVFDELYYSPAWQQVFAIDNSFVLWGFALAVALWAGSRVVTVFCAAALLHLAFDFPLHNHDARQHFWPITDWVFVSPFSYWDSHHHGALIGWIETLACFGLLVVLWLRFRERVTRGLIAGVGLFQLAPVVLWSMLF